MGRVSLRCARACDNSTTVTICFRWVFSRPVPSLACSLSPHLLVPLRGFLSTVMSHAHMRSAQFSCDSRCTMALLVPTTCVKCAFSNRPALLLCDRLPVAVRLSIAITPQTFLCPIYVSNQATDSKTIALNLISRCTGNVCVCVRAMPSLVHVTTKHTAFLAAPVCDRTMYTLYSDNVVFRRLEHFWSNCVVSHSSCPRVVHSRLYQINGHRDLSEHSPAVSSCAIMAHFMETIKNANHRTLGTAESQTCLQECDYARNDRILTRFFGMEATIVDACRQQHLFLS